MTGCSNIECPKDSKKVDNKCYIFHYKVPEEKLTCSTGYELVDNKCVKTEKRKAEYVNTCPNGYTNYTDLGCAKIEDKGPLIKWVCEEGYYSKETLCYKITSTYDKLPMYKCPTYTKTYDSGCELTYRSGGPYYICSSQPNCKDPSDIYDSGTPGIFISYECHTADLVINGKCSVAGETKSGKDVYYCQDGYELTSGRSCRKITKANTIKIYSCKSGEELEGSDCVTRTETNTTLSPVCTDSYKLIEQQCILKEEVSPIKNK